MLVGMENPLGTETRMDMGLGKILYPSWVWVF
jgi:hypothetical protein